MQRKRLTAILMAGAVLLLAAVPAAAQTPGGGPGSGSGFGPGPFRSAPPAGGGIALMQMDRDQERAQLLLQLRLQECEARFLGITEGGRWRMYIPGAPDWVNSDFPSQLRAGDPFIVGCTGVRPDVRLTEANSGTNVTVDAGNRIRIVLDANPSTGFSWVVKSAPNAAVVAAVGESFHVPAVSDLVGAPGHQVLDFRAVAAGTTSITLSYERVGTTDPPAGSWTVNVTVR